MNNRPQVLMLGNGLNLAYGGVSWGTLLKEISVREDIPERLSCPMPMQAILHTNNDIKTAMEKKKSSLYGNVGNAEQRLILQNVLRMGFDDILTTNYSYELEIAALGLSSVKESQIKKLNRHTPRVGRVESKYLLHSYNELNVDDVQNRVWHIHGEARKPDSMILGHYYYANLLARMVKYTYLFKKFQQELGMSIGAYITQCRLREAKSLLRYTDKSLGEISSYLCFSSQSHFQNVFKKHFGVTPKEYRRQYV